MYVCRLTIQVSLSSVEETGPRVTPVGAVSPGRRERGKGGERSIGVHTYAKCTHKFYYEKNAAVAPPPSLHLRRDKVISLVAPGLLLPIAFTTKTSIW